MHIVGSNDTIEDILARYHVSPLELLKLNEQKLLIPGERIIIEK